MRFPATPYTIIAETKLGEVEISISQTQWEQSERVTYSGNDLAVMMLRDLLAVSVGMNGTLVNPEVASPMDLHGALTVNMNGPSPFVKFVEVFGYLPPIDSES